ncbi:DUF2878 domain-containing protein [Marinicella sp. W31]|uniref:DUF2878 domain-containing protein n=1 Tax=Marinicella sp. W31 TaxID=3023713 RepID=UPI003756BE1B
MNSKLTNFILFQLMWPAIVFGAAYQFIWPGVAIVLAMVVFYVMQEKGEKNDINLLLVCGVLGFFVDSTLASTNLIDYSYDLGINSWAPIWIVLLWVGFATTLTQSMAWVFEKPQFGLPFFALAGPFSYLPAEKIGAVNVENTWSMLLLASVLWITTYGILWLYQINKSYSVNYDG